MSFNQPKAPDPFASATTQLNFNQQAAEAQQKVNMINQVTPFGSLQYTSDPNAPGKYSATQTFSPTQQALLDQLQGSKLNIGAAGESLTGAFSGLYGQPPNIDPSSLTNKMMGWGQQYMQPIFNQQQSNLDAKLQNQGITPGSQAWDNAQNLQSRNVNNAYQNLFLTAEPTAFNQAIQQYNLPLQTAYGLAGAGAPVSPMGVGQGSTPNASVGAPNYQQAQQYATDLQQKQFQNTIGDIGQIAGIAAAPFTGGLSMLPGMFAGGWGSGAFGSSPTVVGGSF